MEDKNKLENKMIDPEMESKKKNRVSIHEEFKNDPPKGQKFGGGFGGKQKVEKG